MTASSTALIEMSCLILIFSSFARQSISILETSIGVEFGNEIDRGKIGHDKWVQGRSGRKRDVKRKTNSDSTLGDVISVMNPSRLHSSCPDFNSHEIDYKTS